MQDIEYPFPPLTAHRFGASPVRRFAAPTAPPASHNASTPKKRLTNPYKYLTIHITLFRIPQCPLHHQPVPRRAFNPSPPSLQQPPAKCLTMGHNVPHLISLLRPATQCSHQSSPLTAASRSVAPPTQPPSAFRSSQPRPGHSPSPPPSSFRTSRRIPARSGPPRRCPKR